MSEASTSAFAGQGLHPDPLAAGAVSPDVSRWPRLWQEALSGTEMQALRQALVIPGNTDTRGGVLDDLSTYYKLDREECVRRCLHWEQLSVEEWFSRPRDSVAEIADFYHTTTSWSFDLLWHMYLQTEGFAPPMSAAIARVAMRRTDGRRHLDFGSGVGATAQLFRRLGFETDLADVSTSLLGFARYRLEKRGDAAGYIDLNEQVLPARTYDVITAIDTLVHVAELDKTMVMLHAALKPGGLLFANFDTRPQGPQNAWHLYEDGQRLRWQLQRQGFEPLETLEGLTIAYRRVEPRGVHHAVRGARDFVVLRSPARPIARRIKRKLLRSRE